MRRNKSGIFHTVNWALRRGAPAAAVCYFIVFVIACSNLIAVCVFGITVFLDCQRCLQCLPRQKYQSPSTSAALNGMITNTTKDMSRDMISLDDLLKILHVFSGKDVHLRQSYINDVLTYNNVSVDLQWFSEGHRTEFGKTVTSQLYRGHNLSLETTNLSDLPQRSKRLKDSIQAKTSFVVTSRKSLISTKTTLSSLPRLKQSNKTLSGKITKRDIGRPTISSKQVMRFQDRDVYGGNLQQRDQPTNTSVLNKRVPCLNYSIGLTGRFKPKLQQKTLQELTSMFPMLREGGRFTPTECTPKENTAIIIPYRNRYSHLHSLLLNIVPLLMKQQVKFTIFVIEQELPGIFNRGILFNVGFQEALKLDNFDCFIFHDVDIIPIDDRNLYHCNQQPTHFLTGVNKFQYKLMYENMFGGVVAFTQHQFKQINGASNLYFGWGGEDDDLLIRVRQKRYTVIRKNSSIGLYDMINHSRDKTNIANPLRKRILKFAIERQDTEGLRTTVYTRRSVQTFPLYTWIKVSVNMTRVLQTAPKYMEQIVDQLIKHFLSAETNSTKT